jgi:hypothetical protein
MHTYYLSQILMVPDRRPVPSFCTRSAGKSGSLSALRDDKEIWPNEHCEQQYILNKFDQLQNVNDGAGE